MKRYTLTKLKENQIRISDGNNSVVIGPIGPLTIEFIQAILYQANQTIPVQAVGHHLPPTPRRST